MVSETLGLGVSFPLAFRRFVFLHPLRVCLHCSCSFIAVDMSTHTQAAFSLAVLTIIKSQNHRISQVGRYLRKVLVQPSAQSRVNYEVKPGCSGLFLVDLENLQERRQHNLFGQPVAMPDCPNVEFF